MVVYRMRNELIQDLNLTNPNLSLKPNPNPNPNPDSFSNTLLPLQVYHSY